MGHTGKISIECCLCHTTRLLWPSAIKGNQGKFCSRSCASKANWLKEGRRQKASELYKGKSPAHIEKLIAHTKSPEGRKRVSEMRKNTGKPRVGAGGYFLIIQDGRYVRVHRKVKSEQIGRPLKKKEVVHHWDENRQNNDEKNLCLFRTDDAHHRLHWFARRHLRHVKDFYFEQPWLTEKAD